MEQKLIAKPSLKLTGLDDITANSLNVGITINSFPAVTLEVCPSRDDVEKIGLSDISRIYKKLQRALDAPSENLLTIHAQDGIGNEFNFSGHAINVSYGGGVGSINASVVLTPSYALLNSYKPFLYSSIFKDMLALGAASASENYLKGKDSYLKALKKISGPISSRIKQVLEVSKLFGTKKISGPADANTYAEIIAYEVSAKAEPLVMRLLDNSNDTTHLNFDLDTPQPNSELSGRMNLFIAGVLSDKTNSFMSVLQRLNESFLMAYCPSSNDDNVGMLRLAKNMFKNDKVIPVTTSVSSMIVARENSGLIGMPPSGLVLRAATAGAFSLSEYKKSTAPIVYALAAYPKTPDPMGHVIEAQAPLWMSYRHAAPARGGTWFNLHKKTSEQIKEIVENLKASMEEQETPINKIAEEWAEIMFVNAISQLRTQTILMPLDFSPLWQIGARYNVNNLFTGTLISITHTLNIQTRTAATKLIFSGVTSG